MKTYRYTINEVCKGSLKAMNIQDAVKKAIDKWYKGKPVDGIDYQFMTITVKEDTVLDCI